MSAPSYAPIDKPTTGSKLRKFGFVIVAIIVVVVIVMSVLHFRDNKSGESPMPPPVAGTGDTASAEENAAAIKSMGSTQETTGSPTAVDTAPPDTNIAPNAVDLTPPAETKPVVPVVEAPVESTPPTPLTITAPVVNAEPTLAEIAAAAVKVANAARAASNEAYAMVDGLKAELTKQQTARAATSVLSDLSSQIAVAAKKADTLRIAAEGEERTAAVHVENARYEAQEIRDAKPRAELQKAILDGNVVFTTKTVDSVQILISPNQNYSPRDIGTFDTAGILTGVAVTTLLMDQGYGSSDGGAWHVTIKRGDKAIYDLGFMVSNYQHVPQFIHVEANAITGEYTQRKCTSPAATDPANTTCTFSNRSAPARFPELVRVQPGDVITITAAGWYYGHVTKIQNTVVMFQLAKV